MENTKSQKCFVTSVSRHAIRVWVLEVKFIRASKIRALKSRTKVVNGPERDRKELTRSDRT